MSNPSCSQCSGVIQNGEAFIAVRDDKTNKWAATHDRCLKDRAGRVRTFVMSPTRAWVLTKNG